MAPRPCSPAFSRENARFYSILDFREAHYFFPAADSAPQATEQRDATGE
jgi:hypothetical protein